MLLKRITLVSIQLLNILIGIRKVLCLTGLLSLKVERILKNQLFRKERRLMLKLLISILVCCMDIPFAGHKLSKVM